MSINFISNPVYVINEINTLNYIYSNTLNCRYKKFHDKKIYLKFNDKGRHIKSITI